MVLVVQKLGDQSLSARVLWEPAPSALALLGQVLVDQPLERGADPVGPDECERGFQNRNLRCQAHHCSQLLEQKHQDSSMIVDVVETDGAPGPEPAPGTS